MVLFCPFDTSLERNPCLNSLPAKALCRREVGDVQDISELVEPKIRQVVGISVTPTGVWEQLRSSNEKSSWKAGEASQLTTASATATRQRKGVVRAIFEGVVLGWKVGKCFERS